MTSECLPFRQIPHTSRLFNDFLSDFTKVQEFYRRQPYFTQWMTEEAGQLRYDRERRHQVAEILRRQNQSRNASSKTLDNIERLRTGAAAVVTGQQVGIFGGPLFSIYKALTAIKLADQATQAGVDCVPVFWLATEDHDLEEVNHISVLGSDYSLKVLTVSTQGVPDSPVGSLRFGLEIEPLLAEAATQFGEGEITDQLRLAYRPGETFGSAFAKLFAHVFADWGVILLDAADPELHQVAEPIYRAAIEHAAEIDDALLARGRELELAGYHQQVKVTPSSTLLFTLRNGARVPVHRRVKGNGSLDFLVEDDRIPQSELLNRIRSSPGDFSANVLLRPVVQDFLLPTVAYTGGSAEVAYFAQAAVVYEALLDRVTPVVPRFSATLIEAKPKVLLERYRLALPDLFDAPDALREHLAVRTLPSELNAAFEQADASLQKSLENIRQGLERLDKTLLEAADNAAGKIRHQLESLRARAARAELRQTDVLARHAELLSNMLYPNKTLQERELAGIQFVARHGRDLLAKLYNSVHTDCFDHQVISL